MQPLFKSFFLGGFECSTHKRADGIRLDLVGLTGHDVQSARDYALLAEHGLKAARDGVRWHLIEQRRGTYDWSSLMPQLTAARTAGVQVIWDLFHYGWPNGVDPWSAGMVQRFADFAAAAAQQIAAHTDGPPWFCAVNEISFLAWGGGDKAFMNPFGRDRGGELKRQLVRMSIAAIRAIRAVVPGARFITAEPLINVIPQGDAPDQLRDAAKAMEAQFEALDMLTGRKAPELGGHEDCLDVCGFNVYYNNQWILHGPTMHLGDVRFQPLHEQLARVHDRYRRPMLIAETGTEGVFRAAWLHYIADEVARARAAGTPVGGICLYPILSHRGWDDQRHCPNGLFDGYTPQADRTAYQPLADELARQQALFARTSLTG